MNVKRIRKRQELHSVLKIQKMSEATEGENDGEKGNGKAKPKKELCPKAKRRLKIINANERFRKMQTVARDNTLVQTRLVNTNLLSSPSHSFQNGGISGRDVLNSAILLYGISEGATGTIKDFDKILEALKNDTFLSREFNALGELRAYKLNPDGTPKYRGGGKGKVRPEDVAKAAKKFKFNAKLIKGTRYLGKAANRVGLLLTVLESYEDGEISAIEAMDMLMGVMAFVPGYGWIISGTWSVMRITVPEKAQHGIEMDNGIR